MTTLAGAMADTSMLSDFEGLPVRRAGIEIPGAAGGLREALRIEPREFHKGDTAWLVLEVQTAKIRFDPIDKDEPAGDQERIHVFNVIGATFVEGDIVSSHVEAMKERIRIANAHAKGVYELGEVPVDDDDDGGPGEPSPFGDELQDRHDAGEHADGLFAGCPSCEYEAELAEAEAAKAPPDEVTTKRRRRS